MSPPHSIGDQPGDVLDFWWSQFQCWTKTTTMLMTLVPSTWTPPTSRPWPLEGAAIGSKFVNSTCVSSSWCTWGKNSSDREHWPWVLCMIQLRQSGLALSWSTLKTDIDLGETKSRDFRDSDYQLIVCSTVPAKRVQSLRRIKIVTLFRKNIFHCHCDHYLHLTFQGFPLYGQEWARPKKNKN